MVAMTTPVCNFGRPAADFDLPGVDGKRHPPACARGEKGPRAQIAGLGGPIERRGR